jgi:L-alanine-DL-glutamate epimerase-like enolase superfamily enzyme
MIQLTATPFVVNKRVPLRISRGVSSSSDNILIQLSSRAAQRSSLAVNDLTAVNSNSEKLIIGLGEIAAFSVGGSKASTEELVEQVKRAEVILQSQAGNGTGGCKPLDIVSNLEMLRSAGLGSSVLAGIDIALHDWLGKYVGMPLWKIWGLSLSSIPQTTFTVGIGTSQEGIDRVESWREIAEPPLVKVKLGNPDGIKHDKALVSALRGHLPEVPMMVDANCGWQVSDAIEMCSWLADYGVLYVEQPLPVTQDGALRELRGLSPLPIFVDESCHTVYDIARLAPFIDGINIKLMKCGGLLEARNMISTARAHKLKVMVGCYSDTILANSAMAQLTPLVDYVDLDSHLNLRDDPFSGAVLDAGRVVPTNGYGIGVIRNDAYCK